MQDLGTVGRSRRNWLNLGVTAALALVLALVTAALGSPTRIAPARAWTTYSSAAADLTITLPNGWHPARKRLVPQLIEPREILSLGTGELRVGGGGNCGRYPAAALARMGPDDRLISIQRSAGGPPGSWFSRLDEWPEEFRLDEPVRFAIRDGGVGQTRRLWTTVLDLRLDGHAYWVFVAYGNPPSKVASRQVERILGTLRFS